MRITRRIPPDALGELVERPPRATLAFVRDARIEIEPVAFALHDGRYLFGVRPGAGMLPSKAKLLVDDGPWYFDLRGTWMRGPVTPVDTPSGEDATLAWYELSPEKTVAWHYGRMRQADDTA